MSNELVKRDQTSQHHVVAFKDFDGMFKFAQIMVRSGKLPKDVNPETAVMMIMYGQELGIPPIKSLLETFDPIQGKLSLKPAMMNSMIRKAGHTIEIEKWEQDECIVKGIRKDTKTHLTIRYTMKDAERAGLIGKDNYKKNPKNMLFARAVGNLGRMLFADVIGNMYDSDEFTEQFNQEPEINEIEAEIHTIHSQPIVEKPELPEIKIESLHLAMDVMGCTCTIPVLSQFVAELAKAHTTESKIVTENQIIAQAMKNDNKIAEFIQKFEIWSSAQDAKNG